MKILKMASTSSNKEVRFVEHNDRKFRITYDNKNGEPMGFDSRFKCEVMQNDSWKVIAGKDDIEFSQISYLAPVLNLTKDKHNFMMLMQDHIEMLYDTPLNK